MEEIKILNPLDKQEVTYCVPYWQRDEQIRNSTLKVKGRISEPNDKLRDEPIAIVCYGPSLNDTWEEIRKFKYIITCSGAHKFLIDKGIIPTYHVEVDPRIHKADMLGEPNKDVEYLIASCCHPKMFNKLENFNVKLWHIFANEEEAYKVLPSGEWAITGGSSVGLRAMSMARFKGFINQHIFGMDGCEGKTGKHAGPHPNQPNGHSIALYEGVEYITTPSILECARQTFVELDQMYDIIPTFYGEGLVQEMFKKYDRKPIKNIVLAVKKPILISDEYKRQNIELHDRYVNYGVSGGLYAESVLSIYNQTNSKSILDYGCGKGYLAKSLPFPIWEYDPAIPGKDETPRIADLVVCIDVLEHVEPERLKIVLWDIHRCMKKIGYFIIDLKEAKKVLDDGRNAHLIIENEEWWKIELSELFALGEVTIESYRMYVCVTPKKIKMLNSEK